MKIPGHHLGQPGPPDPPQVPPPRSHQSFLAFPERSTNSHKDRLVPLCARWVSRHPGDVSEQSMNVPAARGPQCSQGCDPQPGHEGNCRDGGQHWAGGLQRRKATHCFKLGELSKGSGEVREGALQPRGGLVGRGAAVSRSLGRTTQDHPEPEAGVAPAGWGPPPAPATQE